MSGAPASGALDWARDGADWPHREASRFVAAGGMRWHVQVMGSGPVVLLAHGTGAASHSWRGVAPLLAPRFTVIAPDLPGHGFSEAPPLHRFSLPGMARLLAALLTALDLRPAIAVGHSAGAAILARMCLDRLIAPRALVSLNGALLPPQGVAGKVFSPLAKLLVLNPLAPRLFAWRASDQAVVERLVVSTGSAIDPHGMALYRRLMRSPGHAAAALSMMANWDLRPLAGDLPRLAAPLTLVAGARDRFIAPEAATRVRDMVPGARLVRLPGLGHLAHEERPDIVAGLVDGLVDGRAGPAGTLAA